MSNLFWYQREVKRKLKDEKPVDASEDWKPTETEVTETYWDCFNVNKVIRGHWTSPEEFTVMLDDGHEQADDVQKPIWKNGKISGVETKRERAWYMSQIPLNKSDAVRFRMITEIENGLDTIKLNGEVKPEPNYSTLH